MMKQQRMKISSVNSGLVYYHSTETGVNYVAPVDRLIQHDTIKLFCADDRRRIRDSTPLHADNYYLRSALWCAFLSACYVITCVVSTLVMHFAGEDLIFFGMKNAMIVILYPFSFIFLDILNASLGYRYAKSIVYISFAIHLFVAFILQITILLADVTQDYTHSINHMCFALFLSAISLLVGDQVNNFIFSNMKPFIYSKPIWLRCFFSSAIGQLFINGTWSLGMFLDGHTVNDFSQSYTQNITIGLCLLPVHYILMSFYDNFVLRHKKRLILLED